MPTINLRKWRTHKDGPVYVIAVEGDDLSGDCLMHCANGRSAVPIEDFEKYTKPIIIAHGWKFELAEDPHYPPTTPDATQTTQTNQPPNPPLPDLPPPAGSLP